MKNQWKIKNIIKFIEQVYSFKYKNMFKIKDDYWKLLTILTVLVIFGLSLRWSHMDNSPPAWDQGLYLYQSTILHTTLESNGLLAFLKNIFTLDPGRVPLLTVITQPAFYFFGPSLDAAVITLNFAWFIIAWSLIGIARELAGPKMGEKAGFFALILFALYPLSTVLSHNYLVELPLVALVCATTYSLWLMHKTEKKTWSIVSGILIGLGLLTKVTFPAFTLPAFIILFYQKIRRSSVGKTIDLYLPLMLLTIIIAGPYYFYNYKQLLEMTASLSSHNIAKLYGFGNVFDIDTILQYLYTIFIYPAIIIAILFTVTLLISKLIKSRKKIEDTPKNSEARFLTHMLIAWFVLPFFLATFGEIKDPRYIYPGLVPIFIFAGIAISRFFQRKLAIVLILLALSVPISRYLYSNSFLSEKSANKYISIFRMDILSTGMSMEEPADPRNWKTREIVAGIGTNLQAEKAAKTVFFLGGNRYYHLRLFDYEGLLGGFRLKYITLPYYSNPDMSIDEALAFINSNSAAGIIYKSGENWPAFSSRLDLEIISHLINDPKYKAIELGVQQPDGSRFTLFINSPKNYTTINSVSDIAGKWKAGDGFANIESTNSQTRLTTEKGVQEFAKIENGIISVPQWNVSGKLTSDFQYIYWDNGFIWERIASTKTSSNKKLK